MAVNKSLYLYIGSVPEWLEIQPNQKEVSLYLYSRSISPYICSQCWVWHLNYCFWYHLTTTMGYERVFLILFPSKTLPIILVAFCRPLTEIIDTTENSFLKSKTANFQDTRIVVVHSYDWRFSGFFNTQIVATRRVQIKVVYLFPKLQISELGSR